MMRGAVDVAVEPRAPLVAEGRSPGFDEPDMPDPRPNLLVKLLVCGSSRLALVCPLDPLLPILPLPVCLEERKPGISCYHYQTQQSAIRINDITIVQSRTTPSNRGIDL
jgi:hypothetical protein